MGTAQTSLQMRRDACTSYTLKMDPRFTFAAASYSGLCSIGGNPSAVTLKAPEGCTLPSAMTMQFSAHQCDIPYEIGR